MCAKILAINGSPNEFGSTYTAMRLVIDELEKQGVEVDFVQLGRGPVQGCTGCGGCRKHPEKLCVHDDLVNVCLKKVSEIDGLLVGSPVHYAGIGGNIKCFLDRFFFTGPNVKFKVAAGVCALRRSGGVPAFQQLNNYFNLSRMIITPSHYWSAVHGNGGEQEVSQDLEGVQMMRSLGRNMAWLLQVLETGKNIPLPESERRIFTNFIR